MRINTNMAALNAWRNMSVNSGNVQKSLEKLSSGYRINRAADDAAGLAVSEKMRAQIRGTQMATRNAQDGISLVQTAEGALTETHSILQRMRELSVQASTATLNSEDAGQVATEFTQLRSEVDRIASDTKFNTKNLLNGAAGVSATASTTAIKNISGTGDTGVKTAAAVGDVKAATRAVVSTDFGIATTDADTKLTINGKDFSFASGTTLADIVDTLNRASVQTGATAAASGTKLVMSSIQTGTNATLSASGSGGNKGATADIKAKFGTGNAAGALPAATATGVDAKISTLGTEVTGFEAVGSRITVTDGTLKGLSFDVTSDATAVTVDVTANNALKIQVGAEEGQQMSISIGDMSSKGLSIDALSVADQTSASSAITALDNAIKQVSTQRSSLGAVQNRLEHTVASLQVTAENLQGAESRIRDVDMASEMATYTKNNILMQASQAMLAQANQSTQGILALLR